MDFISLLANIAQIFSVIWMLLFGGKAISEILQRRAYGRPYTIRPSILLNIILAFLVLLLSSALWFKFNPTSGTTHVAPGTVLYRADWSKGLNGWTQAPGEYGDNWQVINGQLTSGKNATNNGIFLAPAHLQGVANYLVEIRMKIVSTVAYVPTRVQANPKGVVSSLQPLSGCPCEPFVMPFFTS